MLSASPFPRHRAHRHGHKRAPLRPERRRRRGGHATHTRRTLRSRVPAAGPSHAARQELLYDMRKSPVHRRIEENDAGEHFRSRARQTLASTWHRKQRLRQRPMASLKQQHHSKDRDHGGPARRPSGKRRVDQLPPPPNVPQALDVPATRCCTRCRAAAGLAASQAVHARSCRSLAPAPAAASAGQRRSGAGTIYSRRRPLRHRYPKGPKSSARFQLLHPRCPTELLHARLKDQADAHGARGRA